MVGSLLEYETVEAEEVIAILDGRPYDRVRNEEVVPSDTPAERAAGDESEALGETGALSAKDLAGTGMRLRLPVLAPRSSRRRCAATPAGAAARQRHDRYRCRAAVRMCLDPDSTIGSAAVGLWFRAPGAGYDDATPGIAISRRPQPRCTAWPAENRFSLWCTVSAAS